MPAPQNKAMELRITVSEQIIAKILDAVVKAMAQPMPDVSNGQSAQVEALQKQVASLQDELTRMKIQQPKPMPTEQVQKTAPTEKPQAKSAEPAKPLQSVQPAKPAKPNGNDNQPDAEKAEKWVRENLLEWLDQPCPFAKAQGRSWKQLCQNEGEKIVIKGKPMPPRAYLHVLENWDECQAWAKLKAKVALEYGKNGN